MRVGIDFGTSNTSVAWYSPDGPQLIELEPGAVSIPTAIFYETDVEGCLIGNAAIEAYEAGEDGRLMRSIKSVLGTDLIEETTQLGSSAMPFQVIIEDFLKSLIGRVEDATGQQVTEVVQGRPVSFNDTDEDMDIRAENVLGMCLENAGVDEIGFVYEPIAAARSVSFEDGGEHLVFVVDIGGGTSDFSLVHISPGDNGFDVLGSSGVYIGGNDFDRLLSFYELTPLFGRSETLSVSGLPVPAAPYVTLSDWKSLNKLYSPNMVREIAWLRKQSPASEGLRAFEYLIENFEAGSYAHKTEVTKIALSASDAAAFTYDTPFATLEKTVFRQAFERLLTDSVSNMQTAARECLAMAEVRPDQVTDIIMVGGSTYVPLVEQAFSRQFPGAVITSNDRFGAVAKGLASFREPL